jgi:hypothetical protein
MDNMTKAEWNVVRRFASNVIREHGGILPALAYTEYVLAKLELTICQMEINEKLGNEYKFYCNVYDEIEERIWLN